MAALHTSSLSYVKAVLVLKLSRDDNPGEVAGWVGVHR